MISILSDWSGPRLFFDAAHWKPPSAGAIPFHRDNSYMRWTNPPTMNVLWLALEDVTLTRDQSFMLKVLTNGQTMSCRTTEIVLVTV